MNLNQITICVTEMAPNVAFYKLLGLRLIVLNDHYARFELPDGEATFSLDLAPATAQTHAPQILFECQDLDAQHERLAKSGVAFESPPTDMPWLWRQAYLRDPSGNLICLYWAGENRKNPPWRLPDEG